MLCLYSTLQTVLFKVIAEIWEIKVSRVQNDNKTFFWPKRADNWYGFCFLEKTNVCVDLGYLICERCERKRVFACVGMCSFTCLQKHASVYVYLTCFWIDRTEPTVNRSSPPHFHTADQSCHRLCRFLSSPFFPVSAARTFYWPLKASLGLWSALWSVCFRIPVPWRTHRSQLLSAQSPNNIKLVPFRVAKTTTSLSSWCTKADSEGNSLLLLKRLDERGRGHRFEHLMFDRFARNTHISWGGDIKLHQSPALSMQHF